MSIGYIAIIFIRNKPSDVKGLRDINNGSNDNSDNQSKDVNIKYLFEEKKNEDNSSDESDYDEETDEEEEEPTRIERVKMLFSYTFFISICLAYFLAQFIKTLISDWTQIYLIKIHHIKPFSGIFIRSFLLSLKAMINF